MDVLWLIPYIKKKWNEKPLQVKKETNKQQKPQLQTEFSLRVMRMVSDLLIISCWWENEI